MGNDLSFWLPRDAYVQAFFCVVLVVNGDMDKGETMFA